VGKNTDLVKIDLPENWSLSVILSSLEIVSDIVFFDNFLQ
jgi:hypothetical protein